MRVDYAMRAMTQQRTTHEERRREMRSILTSWHHVPTTCTRIMAVQAPKRGLHSSTNGDISKFIPNVAQVDKAPSTALQPHRHQPTDRYKDLLVEYSTKSVQRFEVLKKRAANLAPVRHSENPQFVLQNKLFDEIVTDLSKYDLESVNPYLLILESTTHEQRVEAQRVICAVMKRGMPYIFSSFIHIYLSLSTSPSSLFSLPSSFLSSHSIFLLTCLCRD